MMIAGSRLWRRSDLTVQVMFSEEFAITLRFFATAIRPCRKMAQFNAQYRGLQRVQTAVCPENFVVILLATAVDAKKSQFVRDFRSLCGDQAAVAGAAEIF